MKKVKIDNANYLHVSFQEQNYLVSCPVKNHSSYCCTTCAWFNIEEGYYSIEKTDGTYSSVKIKTITCKGTPIAELEE